TDAKGAERITGLLALKLKSCRLHEPRSAHPKRMTDRDGTTIWIYSLIAIVDSKLAKTREALRGECLIEFKNSDLIERNLYLIKQLLRRRNGPHPHDSRLDPNYGRCNDSRFWDQLVTLHRGPRSDKDCCSSVVYAGGVPGGHGAAFSKCR